MQVLKVVLDGEQQLAAKEIELGRDPSVQMAFLKVRKRATNSRNPLINLEARLGLACQLAGPGCCCGFSCVAAGVLCCVAAGVPGWEGAGRGCPQWVQGTPRAGLGRSY